MELTAKVHSLSLDVQRSNSEMFSVKPMHAHGNLNYISVMKHT